MSNITLKATYKSRLCLYLQRNNIYRLLISKPEIFSSPKNLSLITPPELDFKILSKMNGKAICEEMKISYTVKPILGTPVFWQTEITEVQHLKKFTEHQFTDHLKFGNTPPLLK
jgi:hypothetical protein